MLSPKKEFSIAIPIALLFITFFALIQHFGLINLIHTDESAYFSTAFIIGLLASVSSCMAVVGGLILSLSATYEKAGKTTRPQILFHIGRLISFFLLGGIIGAIGATFTLSIVATFVLSFLVGFVMLILGLRLLDIFDWADKFQILIPDGVSEKIAKLFNSSSAYGPILIGTATFFLPCGFTQSMQVYALSSGSFLLGAFIMLSFAIGTLPVLALVSFGSLGVQNSAYRGVYLKASGIIVIALAFFNIFNSFASLGLLPVLF
jgi:uncharacterized protein